jgi:VIT1/CCC1 family predicted Fe2+/Mn2+ transporter
MRPPGNNVLGRAVRHVRRITRPWVSRSGIRPSEGHHRMQGSFLREVVFGANDGLVSNVALVAGVAGGTNNPNIILLGGIAGLVAGAISMSLGAYVSTKSEHEFRESEEQRERWEVEHMRDQELAETRNIFRLKGIPEQLLDEIVQAVSHDQEQWVKLMMTEELGFADQPPRPKVSAIVMGVAFSAAAMFPVLPYFFTEGGTAFVTSLSLTAAALFGVGVLRASMTAGGLWRRGVEMVVLGGAAVVIANVIGRAVGVTI